MSYEQEQLERAKRKLQQVMNQVPERVRNGGVMETRSWMEQRKHAEKLLKKRGVTSPEVLGAIARLE